MPSITSVRCRLSSWNRPANRSFAFSALSAPLAAMKSSAAFCASSSGVRRAASRATSSRTFGSLFHVSPTPSIGGPAHTATTETSGTLACTHGQSG